MKLLRVASSKVNANGQLEIKVSGAKATYTAEEYAPHGTDARPVKDATVVHADTQADGDDVILGVLVASRKAEVGEHRIFATNDAAAFMCNLWLRADGTILIGDSDTPSEYTNYAVKFNELKAEFDALKASFNSLVSTFNAHVHPVPGVTTGGGATTSSATTTAGAANTSNIDNCKHEGVKYND